MDIAAFHLPADLPHTDTTVIREHEHVRAIAPVLSPDDLRALCTRLAAMHRDLRALPTTRVIAAIDRVAVRLRDPHADEHHTAVAALMAITGLSPAMARHTLERACQDWIAPALEQLVAAEFGDSDAIDGFVARGAARARIVSPPFAFHVFSGNVPGVSITSLVRSLLVRTPVLGKTAAHEPVLAPLFARMLAAEDSLLGDCLAVTWWSGGDEEREAAVLEHARLVVHYGGEAAIRSLRQRAPERVTFVEHGPRISFALIAHPDTTAAMELARAVAVFDQQGCVSPQLAYVLGSPADARAFAEMTATAMQSLEQELPRGRIDASEAAAIHALRARAEFAGFDAQTTTLWSGDRLAWTVIYMDEPAFEGTCLNRTLLIKPLAALQSLAALLEPFREFLQTAGVAGFDRGELEQIAVELADLGVSRVAPLSAMPWPPVAWHHDGRGPLRELVHWIDLEDA